MGGTPRLGVTAGRASGGVRRRGAAGADAGMVAVADTPSGPRAAGRSAALGDPTGSGTGPREGGRGGGADPPRAAGDIGDGGAGIGATGAGLGAGLAPVRGAATGAAAAAATSAEPLPLVAPSATTTMTPPQTEHRARTPPGGTRAGSTRKMDRHSGHVMFTIPPPPLRQRHWRV